VDRVCRPVPGEPQPDATEQAVAEIDGAISLVLTGAARTVQIYGLLAAEAAAATGAAHAQEAGVAFRIERGRGGAITIVVGPTRGG
jgi:hypothetical protein